MWKNVMTSYFLFRNIFILEVPEVANFAGILKIVTMFSKKIWKNQKLCTKIQSISVFSDIAKFDDFRWKNAGVSRTPRD